MRRWFYLRLWHHRIETAFHEMMKIVPNPLDEIVNHFSLTREEKSLNQLILLNIFNYLSFL
jgi:protein subunit release factor A